MLSNITIIIPWIVPMLFYNLNLDYHVVHDACVCFGDILCAKLIRFHRTELMSAATLACMGRRWLGRPVGSLMFITKVGRLCARGYLSPVRDDSLVIRLLIWSRPRLGQVICHEVA